MFQVDGSPDQKPYFETKPRSRPCHIKRKYLNSSFTHLFGKTRNYNDWKIFKFIISSRQLALGTSSVLETLNNTNQSRQKERSVIRSKLRNRKHFPCFQVYFSFKTIDLSEHKEHQHLNVLKIPRKHYHWDGCYPVAREMGKTRIETLNVTARMQTEIDVNECDIDINQKWSEIDLIECDHFLKSKWDRLKRVWTLSQSKL